MERYGAAGMSTKRIVVKELTRALWGELETLFGTNGACAGCWCMFWRLEAGERFDDVKGPEAKKRFKTLVMSGQAKGFLAFVDGQAVGWLSVGQRTDFAKLNRAPSLLCDDADQVHSLPCFFVKRGFRNQGVSTALINAAVLSLKKSGARVLEGYPVKVKGQSTGAAFLYTGTVSLFEKAGFKVVQAKPVGKQRMRLWLSK